MLHRAIVFNVREVGAEPFSGLIFSGNEGLQGPTKFRSRELASRLAAPKQLKASSAPAGMVTCARNQTPSALKGILKVNCVSSGEDSTDKRPPWA